MKILCVYHSVDLDGWMSAAIVKKWFIENHNVISSSVKSVEDRFNHPNPYIVAGFDYLDMYGYKYNDKITIDLFKYDKIIIADISFNNNIMLKLAKHYNKNMIYIDHHKQKIEEVEAILFKDMITINGMYNKAKLTKDKKAACELTWLYFYKDFAIPEIVEMLGAYDSFRHTSYFAKSDRENVLYFQYGARAIIDNYEKAYTYLLAGKNATSFINNGYYIKQYLDTQAKVIMNNSFYIAFPNSTAEASNDYQPYYFKCVNADRFNPKNFNIKLEKNFDGFACFWYNGIDWSFSLYSDTIDCANIAKHFNGGGHKGAAGFRINKIDEFFNIFKLNK